MATDEEKLIYSQRYDTFRHFDSLRWQMPTLALTGAGILLGLSTSDSNSLPPWWAFLVSSLLLLLSAYTVHRIRAGIHRNNIVLKKFADIIGDPDIPTPKSGGASWWFVFLLCSLSAACVFASFILFPGNS